MEPEKNVWISQKILPDDPGSMAVDWDTFNVGLLEDGVFRTIYSCWSQEDADFLLAAVRWYSEFQDQGVMTSPSPATRLKKPVSKRAKKI